jgi:hypothetical protein
MLEQRATPTFNNLAYNPSSEPSYFIQTFEPGVLIPRRTLPTGPAQGIPLELGLSGWLENPSFGDLIRGPNMDTLQPRLGRPHHGLRDGGSCDRPIGLEGSDE